MESSAGLVERLAEAMALVGPLAADSENAGLRFKFRSIANIAREAQRAFSAVGLVFVPTETRIMERTSLTSGKGAAGSAVVVEMVHTLLSPGGEKIAVTTLGEGWDYGDKAVSKAQTMALKTALTQLLLIGDPEDPDGGSVVAEAPRRAQAPRQAPAQDEPEPEPEIAARAKLQRSLVEAAARIGESRDGMRERIATTAAGLGVSGRVLKDMHLVDAQAVVRRILADMEDSGE